jgi:hypothetical protein
VRGASNAKGDWHTFRRINNTIGSISLAADAEKWLISRHESIHANARLSVPGLAALCGDTFFRSD